MAQPFIGQIKIFSFPFAPRGYALCNGQTLAINPNQALFSILGTTYGGNGVTTFQLPNLQGRVPVCAGQGPGLSNYSQGAPGGTETVTVQSTQMPQHSHQFMASTAPAARRPVDGGTFADDAVGDVDYLAPFNATGSSFVTLSPSSLALQGGGQPHNNMQPISVTNMCIALQGVYPSRN